MNNLDVLIIVDALGASTSGNLQSNVYLVDSAKYLGSWNEGQCELHSKCYDGQIVKWKVVAIDSDSDVEIAQFTGQIIDQKICIPQQEGISGDTFWEGRVETQGANGSYQYSCVLTIDGKAMTFDPFLEVVTPTI